MKNLSFAWGFISNIKVPYLSLNKEKRPVSVKSKWFCCSKDPNYISLLWTIIPSFIREDFFFHLLAWT